MAQHPRHVRLGVDTFVVPFRSGRLRWEAVQKRYRQIVLWLAQTHVLSVGEVRALLWRVECEAGRCCVRVPRAKWYEFFLVAWTAKSLTAALDASPLLHLADEDAAAYADLQRTWKSSSEEKGGHRGAGAGGSHIVVGIVPQEDTRGERLLASLQSEHCERRQCGNSPAGGGGEGGVPGEIYRVFDGDCHSDV